ncbi:MAG TPA: hypothetical protein VNL94_00735, partial [Candidatus Binatia bacterium]|nr:hypothetical protein [Candidatus Binatia bacterium]
MRRLLWTCIAAFTAAGTVYAADGSIPISDLLGPGALVVGLVSGIGALWKLHLDDDKRERENGAAWKALAQALQRDVGKLVPSVEGLAKAVSAEHEAAKVDRDSEQRFRDELRGVGARL